MPETTGPEAPLDDLEILVGEWGMTTSLAPDGRRSACKHDV